MSEQDDVQLKVEAWNRVWDEMKRRKLGPAWLAGKLEMTVQRVQNWRSPERGLPRDMWPAVAVALNKTTDWVAGITENDNQTHNLTAEEWAMVEAFRAAVRTAAGSSELALKLARELDQVKSSLRPLAYRQALRAIARVESPGPKDDDDDGPSPEAPAPSPNAPGAAKPKRKHRQR